MSKELFYNHYVAALNLSSTWGIIGGSIFYSGFGFERMLVLYLRVVIGYIIVPNFEQIILPLKN